MSIRQKQSLVQCQKQEQKQYPQMIQKEEILQLSRLDLNARIQEELGENPLLEVEENLPDLEHGAGGPASTTEGAIRTEGQEARETELLSNAYDEYQCGYTVGRHVVGSRGGDGSSKLEAMQNMPARSCSIGDALIGEGLLIDFDVRERQAAEFLAGSLDERGFLRGGLEELAEDCEVPGIKVDEFEHVLLRLRQATHPALGAGSLCDCLLLQLEGSGAEARLARRVVEHHLEDVMENALSHVAREVGATLTEVLEAVDLIRSLDPAPGRDYGGRLADTICPDVIVDQQGNTFEVRLSRERTPRLKVSDSYSEFLRGAKRGDPARKWILARAEKARWFVDALNYRKSTLLRIAEGAFARQKAFLREGAKALVPLRMHEIGDAIGVEISTVSRAVKGKYVQTPQGIFPLRLLFQVPGTTTSGADVGQAAIRQHVKELIESENRRRPLSDRRLSRLLMEQRGIKRSTRTVAKDRNALGIPRSRRRKLL